LPAATLTVKLRSGGTMIEGTALRFTVGEAPVHVKTMSPMSSVSPSLRRIGVTLELTLHAMGDTVPVVLVPVGFVPVALVPVALVPVALVPVALVPVALIPVALVPVALVPVVLVPAVLVPVVLVPVVFVPVAFVPVVLVPVVLVPVVLVSVPVPVRVVLDPVGMPVETPCPDCGHCGSFKHAL